MPNEPVIGGPVGFLIQNPHKLVRDCLRLVVERLYGATVVAEVSQPTDVLKAVAKSTPAIVVLDLSEPDTALSVAEQLQGSPFTKVVFIADDVDQRTLEAAVRAGAKGFALKSDSVEDVMRTLDRLQQGHTSVAPNAAAPLISNYLEILEEKRQRDAAVIESLASAIEAKDSYTGGHTHRVGRLAAGLAGKLDPSFGDNEHLRFGFILHDVGKIGVPEPILLKDSPLSPDEWRVMKTHPIIGLQIISPLGLGDDAEGVVRHHHERWDGAGYPDGLKMDEIPIGARIFAVADTFDAMTNDRPYRNRLLKDEALREIENRAGTQFDPDVAKKFLELMV